MESIKDIATRSLHSISSGNLAEKKPVSTSKTTSQKPQAATSSTSRNADSSDKRIDWLFLRFGSIYGRIWWTNFPHGKALTHAKNEWGETLGHFENLVFKEALQKIREHNPMPPSLPEFFDLCQSISKRLEPVTKIADLKKARPEIGNHYLKEIWKTLKNI